MTKIGKYRNMRKMSLTTDHKIVIVLISLCFLLPVLFPSFVVSPFSENLDSYSKLWYLGCDFKRLVVFFSIFFYTAEQLIFPSVALLLFCHLTLLLAGILQNAAKHLKQQAIWEDSASSQSRFHGQCLKEVENLEKMFSVPVLLLLFQMIVLGFIGLSLEIEGTDWNNIHAIEGYMYLYFSLVGIVSIAYVASKIPEQLEEISKIFRRVYEMALVQNEASMTAYSVKKLAVFKMIYDRPILRLTAWNTIYLDRNLAFTTIGSMLTYGILILQIKKENRVSPAEDTYGK